MHEIKMRMCVHDPTSPRGVRGKKENNGIEPIPCKYDLEYYRYLNPSKYLFGGLGRKFEVEMWF